MWSSWCAFGATFGPLGAPLGLHWLAPGPHVAPLAANMAPTGLPCEALGLHLAALGRPMWRPWAFLAAPGHPEAPNVRISKHFLGFPWIPWIGD